MTDKRLYHLAYRSNIGTKTCGKDLPLKEAVKLSDLESEGWTARAKSSYLWYMPNGVNMGIERAENRAKPEIVAITVFENDDPDKDPKPVPKVDELTALRTENERLLGFVREVAAYKHMVRENPFEAGEAYAKREIAEAARELLASVAGSGSERGEDGT